MVHAQPPILRPVSIRFPLAQLPKSRKMIDCLCFQVYLDEFIRFRSLHGQSGPDSCPEILLTVVVIFVNGQCGADSQYLHSFFVTREGMETVETLLTMHSGFNYMLSGCSSSVPMLTFYSSFWSSLLIRDVKRYSWCGPGFSHERLDG